MQSFICKDLRQHSQLEVVTLHTALCFIALLGVTLRHDDITHRKVVGGPFYSGTVPQSRNIAREGGWIEIVKMLTLKVNERVGLRYFGV